MQLIIKQDDPISEISQAITPEQKRAILAYIGALKSPLIGCCKCDDTGSLSKSVYGDRDCHYCDRADESARVLAWYKSARTDGGDADTLNVYYHGVAAGADLQRARIAELEREVAANREKIEYHPSPAQQESAPAPAALTDKQLEVLICEHTGFNINQRDDGVTVGQIKNAIKAALATASAAPAEQEKKWNKFSEQKPMKGQHVWAAILFEYLNAPPRYEVCQAIFDGYEFCKGDHAIHTPTHWMNIDPMPEPPTMAGIASQQKGGV